MLHINYSIVLNDCKMIGQILLIFFYITNVNRHKYVSKHFTVSFQFHNERITLMAELATVSWLRHSSL